MQGHQHIWSSIRWQYDDGVRVCGCGAVERKKERPGYMDDDYDEIVSRDNEAGEESVTVREP